MTKLCKRCNEIKPVTEYSKAPRNKDGLVSYCKPCVSLRAKEYWQTAIGRMSYIFSTQVSSSKVRGHSLPPYTRNELIMWAERNGLIKLVEAWKDSGYSKNLAPSVDRLDPNKGYAFDNIRLVTWETNNDKAYEDRKSCNHVTKQNRQVRQLTLDGNVVAEFKSISAASRATGITRININDVCREKTHCKTAGGFIWQYID